MVAELMMRKVNGVEGVALQNSKEDSGHTHTHNRAYLRYPCVSLAWS